MVFFPLHLLVWVYQILLLVGVAQANHVLLNASEEIIDSLIIESLLNLPPSSFIYANACIDTNCHASNTTFPFVFYLRKRINRPSTCNTIQFNHIPTDITTPLRGDNVFQNLPDLYNQRHAWFNGIEYLSYVNVGSYGTWIIGLTPGEDNGFVYIRPDSITLVPTGLESTSSSGTSTSSSSSIWWKWNLDGQWKSMKQVTAVCQDNNDNHHRIASSSSSSSSSAVPHVIKPYYFEVDSFYSSSSGKSRSEEPTTHFLIPVARDHNNNSNNIGGTFSHKVLVLFPDGTEEMLYLHNISVICSLGHPIYLSQHSTPTSSTIPTSNTLISNSSNNSSVTRGTVARLANHEVGGGQTWRLTFRRVNADISTATDVAATTNSVTNSSYSFKSSPSLHPHEIQIQENEECNDSNGKADIMVSLHTDTALHSQHLLLDGNWSIRELNTNEYNTHHMKMAHDLEHTQVGDYLWIWSLPTVDSVSSSGVRTSNNRITTSTTTSTITNNDADSNNINNNNNNNNNNNIVTVEATEMVLLCLSHHSSTKTKTDNTAHTTTQSWVFRQYPSDRREQMSQTALVRDTHLVTITLTTSSSYYSASTLTNSNSNSNINSDNNSCVANGNESLLSPILSMTISLSSASTTTNKISNHNNNKNHHLNHHELQGIISIGNNPIPFIRRYIDEKEHTLSPDISSCYLYHAGISLPAPLVYAAELICVLIGAKPVTMIQYTSEGDPSHKFPAIPELTSSIVHTILHQYHHSNSNSNNGDVQYSNTHDSDEEKDDNIDTIDVEYIVQRYRKYETIIFYRPSQRYIVDNLLPRGTAQALHPMPFPQTNKGDIKLHQDYQAQIYNAAWNGLLLGYPDRFVESYCTSFHNDLSTNEKLLQYQLAKMELEVFLKERYNKSITVIHIGWEKPVSEQTWRRTEQIFDNRRGRGNILF